MSNPNIRNLTTLTGNTAVASLTTSSIDIVANGAASNTLLKIVNFAASNITGVNNESISVDLVRSGVAYSTARSVTVPMNSTLVLIGKDAPLYLIEGDTLQARASTNSSIQIVCSYEVLG